MNPTEEWLTQPDGLADRLRSMRERAGLSGKQLAEAAGWAPSKVSRLENGRQMPSSADLDTWARATGADPAAAQELMHLLDDVQTAHQDWRRRMRRGQAVVQAKYNQLVAESRLIRYFETAYVPGLLQTRDYAQRVLQEMVELHGPNAQDVDAAVALRMQRQQAVYDPTKRFEFLLCESVLRWLICPPDVMRGQLDRLQTVIGVPNVRFGILPFSVQLATTPQNSFQMYGDVAVVETFTGETFLPDEETAAYAQIMERLWKEAVVDDAARRLIVAAAGAIPG